MRDSKRSFAVVFAFAALSAVQGLVAAEVTPLVLRYTAAPEQTNAYSLEIESQGEMGREAIAGTLIVSTRVAGTNLVGITMRGQLHPKASGAYPMMGFRPGGPPPLSSYALGLQVQERELFIDERGNLVRSAGDQPLPIPLGQLAASLIQLFPEQATTGWDTDEKVFMLDEPLLQGPAPAFLNSQRGPSYGFYMPGRKEQGVLAARQKTSLKVTEVTPAAVVVHKTLALDSLMLSGTEPRVSATAEGRIEFDRALGLPRRVDLDCKMLAATEEVSRRAVLSLHWRLLEGEELQKALAPPPPPQSERGLSAQEITKLQVDLSSNDPGTRMMAAQRLSTAQLTNATPGLVAQMTSLANDPDDSMRRAALTVLANVGSNEQVPLLIKALNDSDSSVRTAAAKGLGRIKDPRAIEPLVNFVASGQGDQPYFRPSRDSAAAEALARFGPAAEPAVLSLLKDKNIGTRIEACNILKQIGTKRSLGPLKDQALSPSKELSEAAAAACRAIEFRDPR